MTDFAAFLEYYPLPLATKHLDCDETELLLLAHAGAITFYQYPDPTLGLLEWDAVSSMEISALILENTKTGKVYRDYLDGFDTRRSDLVLPREEMLKAHQLLNPGAYAHQLTAPVNNYAERHAANREQLYKVAIGVLADYPDECRGARKEISPEKWTKAILKHAKDYPPLVILSDETITDHLRAAVNIKTRAKRKQGE